jgi:hypothetical protein
MLGEVPKRLHHSLLRACLRLGQASQIREIQHATIFLLKERFVVKGVHLAHASLHEEENNAFCTGLMMRCFWRKHTGWSVVYGTRLLSGGDACEGKLTEATAERLKRGATG